MSEWGAIKAQLVTQGEGLLVEETAVKIEEVAVEDGGGTSGKSAVETVKAALQGLGNATNEQLSRETGLGSRAVQTALSSLRKRGEVGEAGKDGRKNLYKLIELELTVVPPGIEELGEELTPDIASLNASSSVEEQLAEALVVEESSEQEGNTATLSPEEEIAIINIAEEFEEEIEEGEEPFEELGDEIWAPVNVSPDAGKIRFAEDILGDYRGTGRRGKGKGSSRQYQNKGKRKAKGGTSPGPGGNARG